MTAETETRVDLEAFEAPTSLSLFNIREPDRSRLGGLHRDAIGFKLQLRKITAAFDDLSSRVNVQVDAMDQEADVLRGTYQRFSSVITVGYAYLIIVREIKDWGGSDEDAMRFFERCFAINCAVSAKPEQASVFIKLYTAKAQKDKDLPALLQGKFAERLHIDQSAKRLLQKPLPPFDKNDRGRKTWPVFAGKHAVFSRLFIAAPGKDPYYTYPDMLPQWLADARQSNQPPNIERVEEETKQHREDLEAVGKRSDELRRSRTALAKSDAEVTIKSHYSVEKQRRQLFSTVPASLEQLLLFLEGQKETWVNLGDDKTIATTHPRHLKRLSPEQNLQNIIDSFVKERVALSDQRFIALYFEDRLKQGGFESRDQIRPDLQGALNLLLDCLGSTWSQAQEAYQLLEQSHPKIYQALEGLRPFLATLPPHKLKDAQTVIERELQNHQRVASLIWYFSGAFVDRVNTAAQDEKDGLLAEVRSFIGIWLERNWKWAYGELAKALPPFDEGEILAMPTLISEQIKVLEDTTLQ